MKCRRARRGMKRSALGVRHSRVYRPRLQRFCPLSVTRAFGGRILVEGLVRTEERRRCLQSRVSKEWAAVVSMIAATVQSALTAMKNERPRKYQAAPCRRLRSVGCRTV